MAGGKGRRRCLVEEVVVLGLDLRRAADFADRGVDAADVGLFDLAAVDRDGEDRAVFAAEDVVRAGDAEERPAMVFELSLDVPERGVGGHGG